MNKLSIFVFVLSLPWLVSVNLSCSPVKIHAAQNFLSARNAQGDLRGENWGDQIVFWWSYHAGATEYIVYRAPSSSGPWEELGRMSDAVARTSGPKIDDTPDARLIDLCYKVEAIDELARVIRIYQPMCVPKFAQ
jgi:hypothetical protein